MKVHFPFQAITTAIILVISSACYSVEFYPTDEYPGLRRADVEEVEIRTSAPRRPYERLGQLVIKDPAADLHDRNFRRFLKNQARDRGAEGLWLVSRGLSSSSMITGSPDDSHQFVETGQLRLESGVLTLVLFNYKRVPDDAHEQESRDE
jgi:hypothetical protein